MKRNSSSSKTSAGSSGSRKRYSSSEKRGQSEYKKEWSRFMTHIDRKRLTGGASTKTSAAKPSTGGANVAATQETTQLKKGLDIKEDIVDGGSTFSYLFHSKSKTASEQSQKKQEAAKRKMLLERKESGKRRQRDEENNNNEDDEFNSKMERAAASAKEKGLALEGLNRKQRRAALQLTRTEAVEQVEEQRKKITPKDLMDQKLQWYQQGPYPLDEITEKLVNKKALKHVKTMPELKLDKYNYQLIHPSWLARRQRKRYEEQHALHEGKREVFADSDDSEDDDTVEEKKKN